MADKLTQVEIAERLQVKWLERMERMLDDNSVTSTDMATLSRVLLANGWTLDPTKLPQSLRDKLTEKVDPEDLGDERLLHIA